MNQNSTQQEAAFIELIQQNQPLVYKVCNIYALNDEERKDLFQEIVLQAWKSYQRFNGESAITTWLYRVSLNTAMNHERTKKRRPVITYPEIPEHHMEDHVPHEQQEQYRLMQKLIADLPKLEKALVLLYLEDKSYNEIADIMGISQSNVGTKLSRIKEQMKRKAQLLTR